MSASVADRMVAHSMRAWSSRRRRVATIVAMGLTVAVIVAFWGRWWVVTSAVLIDAALDGVLLALDRRERAEAALR